MLWSKTGLSMVIIMSDLDQTDLSEEELLELRKINSGGSLFLTKFNGQNFIFKCSWVFLFLYASLTFAASTTLFDGPINSTDFVAQSYRDLFRVRLIIVLLFATGIIITFYDGRIFKGFVLSALMVLVNYSVDMFYFYQEHLSQTTGALPVLYYSRPLLLVALVLMYRNYNRP